MEKKKDDMEENVENPEETHKVCICFDFCWKLKLQCGCIHFVMKADMKCK